jgi:hypothetical protein
VSQAAGHGRRRCASKARARAVDSFPVAPISRPALRQHALYRVACAESCATTERAVLRALGAAASFLVRGTLAVGACCDTVQPRGVWVWSGAALALLGVRWIATPLPATLMHTCAVRTRKLSVCVTNHAHRFCRRLLTPPQLRQVRDVFRALLRLVRGPARSPHYDSVSLRAGVRCVRCCEPCIDIEADATGRRARGQPAASSIES